MKTKELFIRLCSHQRRSPRWSESEAGPWGSINNSNILYKVILAVFITFAIFSFGVSNIIASEIPSIVNWMSLSDKDISPEGRLALSLDKDKWRHAETKHFIYHFIDKKGAETVLIHAEVYYKWIKDIFGIEEDKWNRKVHLYIFPDEKAWNDFKTKIRFSATAEAYTTGWELFMYRKPYWLSPREVLAHEITHIIVFRFVNGPLPLFLDEGFAEFISYKAIAMQVTGGNIGSISLIPEKDFIPLEELVETLSYPQGSKLYTFYSESELLVRFLLLNYESKKFYVFLKEVSQGKPFKEVVRDIYKIDFKTFREEFKAYAVSKK